MYTPLLCVSSRSFMVLSNSSGDTFTLFCKLFVILDRFSKSLFNFGPKSLVIFIENMAEASPEPYENSTILCPTNSDGEALKKQKIKL